MLDWEGLRFSNNFVLISVLLQPTAARTGDTFKMNNNVINRHWAKRTPSPSSLREKVMRNCMSVIKSKRNSLFDANRTNGESRNDVLKAFVSEIYFATKQEEGTSHQGQSAVFDESSENFEQSELLAQIADAIEFELERQREIDSEIYDFMESEEFSRISLFEEGEDVVICPMCR